MSRRRRVLRVIDDEFPAIRSTDRRRFKNAQQQQLRVAADDGDDVNAGNANNESNSTDDEKEYEMPSEEDPLPWSTPAASSADDDASNNAKTEEKPKILSYAERLNIMKKEKEEAGGGGDDKRETEQGTVTSFNLPVQKDVFEISEERPAPSEEDLIMNE